MRSQTRYVIIIVALLTAFSLYTIIKNRPATNFQLVPDESTIRYDEAEEAKFLENNHIVGPDSHQTPADRTIDERKPRAEKLTLRTNIKKGPHLIDTLSQPGGPDKFNFQACDMSTCFDYSRCDPDENLKVHIIASPIRRDNDLLNISGESNIIHQHILHIIRNSKHFEPNPDKACIFLFEDDTLDRDPLSASFRPYVQDIFQAKHGFGMNFLVFNLYSGTWPDYKGDDFSGVKIGAAILAKASNDQRHHRNSFDISIPLFSYLHPAYDANVTMDWVADSSIKQLKKSYFLTFKGKRYVIGSGSETRNSLHHLNNQRDIVMLTTCRHGKKWRDVKDSRCGVDEIDYNRHDFVDLMRNSTFCLTPRGRRLGSFRFLEALSYGCIPVILSDGWVWPFGDIIDWSKAAIQFDEDQILLVPDMLRDISLERIERMQLESRQLYRKYFSSIERIVLTTLSIIKMRIKNKADHFD